MIPTMTQTSKDHTKDSAEIIRAMRAYHAAMVAARVSDLDQLLAQDYVLVHITGATQAKREWFDIIGSGQFDYHSIEIEESSLVPVRAYIEELLPDVLEGRIDPGRVFDHVTNLDGVRDGYRAMNERRSIKVIIEF